MGCGNSTTDVVQGSFSNNLNQSQNFSQNSPDSRPKDPFKIHDKKHTADQNKQISKFVQEIDPKIPQVFEQTKNSEAEEEKDKKKQEEKKEKSEAQKQVFGWGVVEEPTNVEPFSWKA